MGYYPVSAEDSLRFFARRDVIESLRNLRNPAQHGYVGFKRKVYKKAKETEVFQYTDLKAMSSLSCDDFEEDCTGASSNTIALC